MCLEVYTYSCISCNVGFSAYPFSPFQLYVMCVDDHRVCLYEDRAVNAVTTALKSSSDHPGVQFTGLSALSNLCRAGEWM